MTRFARSKGSKASNERVPEEATSWQEMKDGLLRKSEKKVPPTNIVKDFYKEKSNSQETKWSEFPDIGIQKHDSLQNKVKRKAAEENIKGQPKKKVKVVEKEDLCPTKQSKTESQTKSKTKKEAVDSAIQTLDRKSNKKNKHKPIQQEDASAGSDFAKEDVNQKFKQNTKSKKKSKLKKLKFPSEESYTEQQKSMTHHSDSNPKHQSNKFQKKPFQKNFGKPFRQNKFKLQKEHKRRKPNSQVEKIFINGIEIELAYFDGFPIKKEDADRLKQLKKDMILKGLPKSEIAAALKLERRRAEKALAREKKKVCFNCRKSGHTLSECPELGSGSNAQATETGICFKCGSTEHTHFECKVIKGDNFKFAQCFVCKEQGHIARQCPDNNRGLYPKGGACRMCGDVTHLKKDCPKYQAEQNEQTITADTIAEENVESLENQNSKKVFKKVRSQKVVKF